MKTTLTLNQVWALHPSPASWQKLLKHFGKPAPDDEEFSILDVWESNGLDDALFCVRQLGLLQGDDTGSVPCTLEYAILCTLKNLEKADKETACAGSLLSIRLLQQAIDQAAAFLR